jgi:hypothetical protein
VVGVTGGHALAFRRKAEGSLGRSPEASPSIIRDARTRIRRRRAPRIRTLRPRPWTVVGEDLLGRVGCLVSNAEAVEGVAQQVALVAGVERAKGETVDLGSGHEMPAKLLAAVGKEGHELDRSVVDPA